MELLSNKSVIIVRLLISLCMFLIFLAMWFIVDLERNLLYYFLWIVITPFRLLIKIWLNPLLSLNNLFYRIIALTLFMIIILIMNRGILMRLSTWLFRNPLRINAMGQSSRLTLLFWMKMLSIFQMWCWKSVRKSIIRLSNRNAIRQTQFNNSEFLDLLLWLLVRDNLRKGKQHIITWWKFIPPILFSSGINPMLRSPWKCMRI